MKRLAIVCAPRATWWVAFAAVVPMAATVVAVFGARAAGDGAPFIPASALPTVIGLQIATGAVGEELGWRGYLLPRLGARVGKTMAGWTMAVLWTVWHIPVFLAPEAPHDVFPLIPALLVITLFGVFMAVVFDRAGESVLATVAAHLSLNTGMAYLGAQFTSPVYWWILAGIFGVFATLTLFRSLGHSNGRKS